MAGTTIVKSKLFGKTFTWTIKNLKGFPYDDEDFITSRDITIDEISFVA